MHPVTRDNPSRFHSPEDGFASRMRRLFRGVGYSSVEPNVERALVTYLDLVVEWGARMDLTAARSADELVDLSFADAAVLAREELRLGKASDEIVDVGSGAGAPGIPWLLLLSAERGLNLPAALIEPRVKRVAFLRTVLATLGLTETRVERKRSDELGAGSFDVAMARATLPPPEWLREGARLSRGAVWVLLARDEAPGLSGYEVSADVSYEWPLTGVSRRAVRYVATK